MGACTRQFSAISVLICTFSDFFLTLSSFSKIYYENMTFRTKMSLLSVHHLLATSFLHPSIETHYKCPVIYSESVSLKNEPWKNSHVTPLRWAAQTVLTWGTLLSGPSVFKNVHKPDNHHPKYTRFEKTCIFHCTNIAKCAMYFSIFITFCSMKYQKRKDPKGSI